MGTWGGPNAGLLQSRNAVEAASRQVAASTDATSWRESALYPPAMVGARGDASMQHAGRLLGTSGNQETIRETVILCLEYPDLQRSS